MNRKKFFLIGSAAFLGFTFLKSNLLNFFKTKEKSGKRKLSVKINPSAVSRNRKEGSDA